MKTNKDSLQKAMDRRLSFLDELPSCRAAVQYRIAQEEEPVMKKKVSFGFVLAMIMVLLAAAALATGLLLSAKVSATQTADRALEKAYGITAEMQTFFARTEEELEDGSIRVTYTGAGWLEYALGTYTAVVRDGKAEVIWSHDGEDTTGGYDAECWGVEQIRQMMEDSLNEESKAAYLAKADAIAVRNGAVLDIPEEAEEDEEPRSHELTAEDLAYLEQREAQKTAALKARKLSEEELIAAGREFIISYYGLDEEQTARMELYTNSFDSGDNTWYETVDGKPCFQVEYLLYDEYTTEQYENGEPRTRRDMDGYYIVYVNVEDGTIEQYEYNSALGGIG